MHTDFRERMCGLWWLQVLMSAVFRAADRRHPEQSI